MSTTTKNRKAANFERTVGRLCESVVRRIEIRHYACERRKAATRIAKWLLVNVAFPCLKELSDQMNAADVATLVLVNTFDDDNMQNDGCVSVGFPYADLRVTLSAHVGNETTFYFSPDSCVTQHSWIYSDLDNDTTDEDEAEMRAWLECCITETLRKLVETGEPQLPAPACDVPF